MKASKSQFGPFSVRGLGALNKRIQDNPAIMEDDWRETAMRAFEMTDQQKEFLLGCPEELHKRIQGHFRKSAERVRGGGGAQLKVTAEDDGVRALYLLSSAKDEDQSTTPTLSASTAIRIVCCDANCRDWHWC